VGGGGRGPLWVDNQIPIREKSYISEHFSRIGFLTSSMHTYLFLLESSRWVGPREANTAAGVIHNRKTAERRFHCGFMALYFIHFLRLNQIEIKLRG